MNQLAWKKKRMVAKAKKYLWNHTKLRPGRKKYYGKKILNICDTGEWIAERIRQGEPFAAGRIGDTELRAMVACQPENRDTKEMQERLSLLISLAGFYGDQEDFKRFARLMEEALGEMDIIGVWFNQMEDYMVHTYGRKELVLGRLEGLEPWYNPTVPWTKELAGKKVVCIHPFKESIEKQFLQRDKLFQGSDILPAFDLRCVAAVQNIGAGEDKQFPSWFDGLDYMFEEAMKEPFDIALIACGAYGLPLAARLKKAGKTAIHMGGALQLLFGVKGKRWDDFAPLNDFYNEYWSYPKVGESLKDKESSKNIEGGCYW